MELTERLVDNKDWITLLFLGISLLIVMASFLNARRLKQLFALPYNDLYLVNYDSNIWHPFNILLFVIANLILGLFIYLGMTEFYPDKVLFTSNLFLKILGLLMIYWMFKYLSGLLVAFLFEIKKWQKKMTFVKISYFFSSSLYLLVFLIFSVYSFTNSTTFLIIIISFYSILLLIRYFHFLRIHRRDIIANLFYFILYLCALEIAPLLIAIKIGT